MTDEKKRPQREYDVGYGKPPIVTRFQPGKSGNPSGKKKPTRSIREQIEGLLERKISATENGRPVKISIQTAILTKLTDNALKGDLKAAAMLFNLRDAPRSSTASNVDLSTLDLDDQKLFRQYIQDTLDREEVLQEASTKVDVSPERQPAPVEEKPAVPKGPPIRVTRMT